VVVKVLVVFWVWFLGKGKEKRRTCGVVEKRCERVCVLAGGENRTREAKREREGNPFGKRAERVCVRDHHHPKNHQKPTHTISTKS
jgi:hypothetical protein